MTALTGTPCIRRDRAWTRLLPDETGTVVLADGGSFGFANLAVWMAAGARDELDARGIALAPDVDLAATPAGALEVSRAIGGTDAPAWEVTYRDLPPPPMPPITDGQFGEGLWRDGMISYEDYLAFVGPGTIPPRLDAILDRLPDDDTGGPTPRKVARGLVVRAQRYEFANPLVEIVRAGFEREDPTWTPDHLRARWLVWAALAGGL